MKKVLLVVSAGLMFSIVTPAIPGPVNTFSVSQGWQPANVGVITIQQDLLALNPVNSVRVLVVHWTKASYVRDSIADARFKPRAGTKGHPQRPGHEPLTVD